MRSAIEAMWACECGIEGRLKQGWGEARKDPLWQPVMRGIGLCGCCGCCGMNMWRVHAGRPFQLTEWRRDLIACLCGAEGRLIQEWNFAWRNGPTPCLSEAGLPSWMGTSLLKEEYCSGCHDLCRGTTWYKPWYAVPGVDLLIGPGNGTLVMPGAREPLVRRYCSLEG